MHRLLYETMIFFDFSGSCNMFTYENGQTTMEVYQSACSPCVYHTLCIFSRGQRDEIQPERNFGGTIQYTPIPYYRPPNPAVISIAVQILSAEVRRPRTKSLSLGHFLSLSACNFRLSPHDVTIPLPHFTIPSCLNVRSPHPVR